MGIPQWVLRVAAVLEMANITWPPRMKKWECTLIVALAVFINVGAYIDGIKAGKAR